MKTALLSIIAVLIFSFSCINAYAVENYEFRGNGISLDSNIESPTLYKSVFRMNFNDLSEVSKGYIILKANMTLTARMIPDEWNLSYNADGSFIDSGPLYTLQDNHY